MIETRVEAAGLPVDEREWNALIPHGDTHSIFQTYAWARSWLDVYGSNYEPYIVSASESGRLMGLAPLVVSRSPSRTRTLQFLGTGRADYCDFLTRGDKFAVLSALVSCILSTPGWDVLRLDNLPASSRTVEMLEDICRSHRCPVLRETQFICPTLVIANNEEYVRKLAVKPSLRRRVNRLEREGSLVCRHLTRYSEVEPHIDSFFAQHIQRWQKTRSPSLFVTPLHRTFYRHLARELCEKEWLLFSTVELNDEPIAYHYGFDYNGVVTWYKPTFNTLYASASPACCWCRA